MRRAASDVRLLRAEFYSQSDPNLTLRGRLKGLFDVDGNPASFAYSLDRGDGTFLETVTDAHCVPTQILRDGRGNVLRRVQQEVVANITYFNITLSRYTDAVDADCTQRSANGGSSVSA